MPILARTGRRFQPAPRLQAWFTHLQCERWQEIDIDISQGATESVDRYRELQPDLVVTVCDSAAQNCPVWLGDEEVEHMPFDDPTKVVGSDSDRISACRQVRDLMRDTLLPYLQSR